MDLAGKRVLVMGAGRSGLAATGLLRARGARVTAIDSGGGAALEANAAQMRGLGAEVLLGFEGEPEARAFDLAVVSPGIDPRRGWVPALESAGVPVWAELELGWRHCHCPVVAITGTNGKTTTTELCDAVLRAGGLRSRAAGNIGDALSAVAGASGALDAVVVEVSSFQLERCRTFRPRVAAFLNFEPDHMDRYDSASDYLAAKMRLFEHMGPEDLAIANLSLGLSGLRPRLATFSARGDGAHYGLEGHAITDRGVPVADLGATRLRGPHNAENAMVAVAAGQFFGVGAAQIQAALERYEPAAHRCEWVGEWGGVAFINDSKATNPAAVAVALESQSRPVVLIAGGSDKRLPFEPLAGLVAAKVRAAVLIGQTADAIAAAWPGVRQVRAGSMDEAVAVARAEAREGDVVMLSPGCASFDMFVSYADRGERFKSAVRKISAVPDTRGDTMECGAERKER